MISETRHIKTQLTIIGSGIAGFAASIFALNRGISTTQVGNTGAIAYTTGYLDLLGKEEQTHQKLDDPWSGLETLRTNAPTHPLSLIEQEDILEAFNQFTHFLNDNGIKYNNAGKSNLVALTPAGTSKRTLCVPETMMNGVHGLQQQTDCVIVDIKGLKGFSANQVVANLKSSWPNIRSEKVTFPEMEHGEIYPEVMARALEVKTTRDQFSELLKSVAGSAKMIGLPAILGMHNPDLVLADLEEKTGLKIFEIPTMPPSVPGIRLRELFEQVFPQKGLSLIPQQKVKNITFTPTGVLLELSDSYGPIKIESDTVILATGRFLSGGLEAKIQGIEETLLDLPVKQPDQRSQWYNEGYAKTDGHPINKAGIETDNLFRPLGDDAQPFNERLFAAGIILANQDWIRSRSGAGIAISSAYKAVESANNFLNNSK